MRILSHGLIAYAETSKRSTKVHPLTHIAILSTREANKLVARYRHQLPFTKKTQQEKQDLLDTARNRIFEACRDCIEKFHPDHQVCRDISDAEISTDHPLWHIEPLDGCLNFLRGIEHFASAITVLDCGRPSHGVVIDHCRNEIYQVSKSEHSLRDGRRIRVSSDVGLSASVIGYERTGHELHANRPLKARSQSRAMIFDRCLALRETGSVSLNLAHVASGLVDGCVIEGLSAGRFYAPIMLVRAAGGVVGDHRGGEVTASSTCIVAGGAQVFRSMIKTLRQKSGADQTQSE